MQSSTAELHEKHQFKKPILITSAFHMKRAIKHFQNEGVHVQAYPTGFLENKANQIISESICSFER